MDKSETKLVYTYGDDGKYTGTKTLDYTDRSPSSGAWQIPAGCTETAPYIEPKDSYDIIWNDCIFIEKNIIISFIHIVCSSILLKIYILQDIF